MPLSILIVDDSLLARRILAKSLPVQWDVEIFHASSGNEAIVLSREGKAAVMFLDLTMPDMDGYEVLEILRKENIDSKVVVVSADIQAEAWKRAQELGAIAFVTKPINTNELIYVLKEYGFYE
ncbi:MAG: response regulator [Pseudomonadota bacterium]